MYKLIYHGEVLSKKNSKQIIYNRRTGHPMLVSNKSSLLNEKALTEAFRWQIDEDVFDCPVEVRLKVWLKDRRRRDGDNQYTMVQDALVEAGLLEDDDYKHIPKHSVELMGYDKEDPRIEVEIIEIKE